MKLYIMFITVALKSSLDVAGLRVKLDDNFGGVGIPHEESIFTFGYKGRVYCKGSSIRICFGAWVQCIFPLLGVDDVKISSPDYKVCECNFVGDVLVSIQGNNGRRNQAPVD